MSSYSVRGIPNVPSLRKMFSQMARGSYRARGRGVPPGKHWRDVAWGTALCEAPKFTAYYGRGNDNCHTLPRLYFEFVDVEPSGKPRVRWL